MGHLVRFLHGESELVRLVLFTVCTLFVPFVVAEYPSTRLGGTKGERPVGLARFLHGPPY